MDERTGGGEAISDRGKAVRALMRGVAAELVGRIELHMRTLDEEDELIELSPANPRAVAIVVEHSPVSDDAEICIGLAGGLVEPVYPAANGAEGVARLRSLIIAVTAGDVVRHEGAGRSRYEVTLPDGEPCVFTNYRSARGCLPAPGWRRRARITHFEPY